MIGCLPRMVSNICLLASMVIQSTTPIWFRLIPNPNGRPRSYLGWTRITNFPSPFPAEISTQWRFAPHIPYFTWTIVSIYWQLDDTLDGGRQLRILESLNHWKHPGQGSLHVALRLTYVFTLAVWIESAYGVSQSAMDILLRKVKW